MKTEKMKRLTKKKQKILNFNFSISEKSEDLLRKYENFTFWCLTSNEKYSLYRIIDGIPTELTQLPTIEYNMNSKKSVHMKQFFEQENIFYTPNSVDIQTQFFFLDPNIKDEYVTIDAPLFKTEDEFNFLYVSPSYVGSFPTRRTVECAHDYFKKYVKSIKEEEILFDFAHLSMDGGICAFFEDYHLDVSLHLSKRYYIHYLQNNPNPEEEPYNEYTKLYTDENNPASLNFVVFDTKKIADVAAKFGKTGVEAVLPKEVASLVIGPKGSNMCKLLYNLGIPKISFNPEKVAV